MKRLNKNGFTLIELLAVIVVLSIILVITVPTVLGSLSSARQDALQSSANSTAQFYEDQIALKLLGKGDSTFATDAVSNGLLVTVSKRCITYAESKLIGLNVTDYAILITSNDVTNYPSDSLTANSLTTSNCSTVELTNMGQATVILRGIAGGKFVDASTPLTATSNN